MLDPQTEAPASEDGTSGNNSIDESVLVHCERGFRRVTLPSLEADGTVAKWFSCWQG